MSRTVTQQALAERLSLSRATISKSLRYDPTIRPDTRAQVLDLANKLGYQLPVRSAEHQRIESVKSKNVITVLFQGQTTGAEYVTRGWQLLAGISEAAQRSGYTLDVASVSKADWSRFDDPSVQPASLRHKRAGGVIILQAVPLHVVEYISKRWPTVCASTSYEGVNVDWVDIDAYEAGNMLVNHLWDAGHRRIGYVGYRTQGRQRRFAGYVDALARRNVELKTEYVINVWQVDSDRHAIADRVTKLTREQGVTGWVCGLSGVAVELLEDLQAMNLSVPEELSIASFGDHVSPTDPIRGRLSAAVVPVRSIGSSAFEQLRRRMDWPNEAPQRLLINCPFQTGRTIGPPAQTHFQKEEDVT